MQFYDVVIGAYNNRSIGLKNEWCQWGSVWSMIGTAIAQTPLGKCVNWCIISVFVNCTCHTVKIDQNIDIDD